MDVPITIAPSNFSTTFPELFHYTSLAGLTGIYQSNTLWSTNYQHLNDSTEMMVLKDWAVEELATRFKFRFEEQQQKNLKFCQAIDGNGGLSKTAHEQAVRVIGVFYEMFFEGRHHAKFGEPYITSFCAHTAQHSYEKENGLLSQWRGYGDGGGYCIVFDTEELISHLLEEFGTHYWLHLHLNQVSYATENLPESELIGAAIEQLDMFFGQAFVAALAGKATDILSIPQEAVVSFLKSTTLLKHQGFIEENEIRIVSIPGTQQNAAKVRVEHKDFKPPPLPTIHARINRNKDCEYLCLFEGLGKKLPIKRIIVGPSLQQDRNYILAKELTSDALEITKSKTPYIEG